MSGAERKNEVEHQNVIAYHHFAAASSECLDVYKNGYYISTVMVSQAVAEGILRFILERNNLSPDKKEDDAVEELVRKGIITQKCGSAFINIRRSFRNDVHHMNTSVGKVPFPELATRNINDLATIECEIFAYSTSNGRLFPNQPKYWDISPEGTAPVFLRLDK